MATPRAVLFLGTANAARSILAECILTRLGNGGFRAHSAGSHPAGVVAAEILTYLRKHEYSVEGLRSKTWDEFAGEDAPTLDIVITLSNSLIGAVCPVFWTGRPATSHWPLPDGDDLDRIHDILERRIAALVALPVAEFDAMTLQMKLDAIGRS
jgi:protein-tyrosine-phosphatase